MVDNMKNYFELYSNSKTICSRFEDKNNNQFVYSEVDPYEVLFDIICFYQAVLRFKDKTGYYYFDDHTSENFLAKLEDAIFDQFDNIVGSYKNLAQFFECKSSTELRNHKDSWIYYNIVKNWISDQYQAKDFYLNHLVYYWVLFVKLNIVSLITYTSASKLKKRINREIKPYRDQLKEHILKLNSSERFYKKNVSDYYVLFDWRERMKF